MGEGKGKRGKSGSPKQKDSGCETVVELSRKINFE